MLSPGVRLHGLARRVRRFALGSLIVMAAMALLSASVSFSFGRPLAALPQAGVLGAASGLVASALAYAVLLAMEASTTGVSDIRLLELASPGHPLLKRLMMDAPGTYSHSVLAGHLAEQAAETIGANPLLARVGAYYHDIGKLHRPEFFCENLSDSCACNPHDTHAPSQSAIIITAHVTDGLALARAYGLPEEVCGIIRQHHGTSLVSYFYEKAARSDGATLESDFRYGGERPSSREAALVMLADASEAAARCIRTPTLPRVEAVVRQVVEQRQADRQLDEARLSVSDIEKVVRVYARMLVSMQHPRIEYGTDASRRTASECERVESSRS